MEYEIIVKKWKNKKIRNVNDLQTALNNFRILFAYHSGVIENQEITYHNTREIFENGKIINFTGDIRTVMEIQNQKFCYEYLKDKIIAKEPITPELVKKVHFLLVQGTYDEKRYSKGERPGEYKKHDYVIGKEDEGAAPDEVAEEIENLCNEVNSYKGDQILKVAAFFHCNFENIHPFADGNGRVGRTLMNYYLMINDYPPMIIYNEDKDLYYQALEKFDQENDIDYFQKFMRLETYKTWEERPENKHSLREHVAEYEFER